MITEVTRIIKLFNSKTAWESIALHLLTVILPLMLQKPSANSKKKDHTRYLQKRLTLWKEGRIMEIISECEEIQKRMSTKAKRDESNLKGFHA